MKYLGGKHRYGGEIAAIVGAHRKYGQLLIEPMCGGLNVTKHFSAAYGPIVASDEHTPLINLYQAIQDGWEPPNYVDEELYKECKEAAAEGDQDPLIGFVGFACSFSGKWFAGYARDSNHKRNYAAEAYRSLKKDIKLCKKVEFKALPYQSLLHKLVQGAVIYFDPPYGDTTGYSVSFCTKTFWNHARKLGENNKVFVSEYKAPSDFKCIWSKEKHLSVRSHYKSTSTEKLFKYEPI